MYPDEDTHDPKYDEYEISKEFFSLKGNNSDIPDEVCVDDLTLHLYPSDELKDDFTTNRPLYYTITVIGIFFFTALACLSFTFPLRIDTRLGSCFCFSSCLSCSDRLQ